MPRRICVRGPGPPPARGAARPARTPTPPSPRFWKPLFASRRTPRRLLWRRRRLPAWTRAERTGARTRPARNPSPRKSKSSARSRPPTASRRAPLCRKPRGRDVRARRAGTRRASRRKHSRFQSRSFLVARLRRWRRSLRALFAPGPLRGSPSGRAGPPIRARQRRAPRVRRQPPRAPPRSQPRIASRGPRRTLRTLPRARRRAPIPPPRLHEPPPLRRATSACPPREPRARAPHRARSPGHPRRIVRRSDPRRPPFRRWQQ